MKIFFCLVAVLCLASCQLSVVSNGSDTTTNEEVVSAITVLGELIQNMGSLRTSDSYATACSARTYSACDATTFSKVRYFSASAFDTDGCTRGTGTRAQEVFGSTTLTYSTATCAETTGSTVTRTYDNHYELDVTTGTARLIYSEAGAVSGISMGAEDLLDYRGIRRSGGAQMIRTTSGDLLMIPGIHRRGLSSARQLTFWHTLYTGDPLHVSRIGATSLIPHGVFYLAQNRGTAIISQTVTNLLFENSCNYPLGGSAVYIVTPTTGSVTSFTVNFTASCGTVTIDGSSKDLAGG